METETIQKTVVRLPHGRPEVLRLLGYPIRDGQVLIISEDASIALDPAYPVIIHEAPLSESTVRRIEALERPDPTQLVVHLAEYLYYALSALTERLQAVEKRLEALERKGGGNGQVR